MDTSLVVEALGTFVGLICGTLVLVEMLRYLSNGKGSQPKPPG